MHLCVGVLGGYCSFFVLGGHSILVLCRTARTVKGVQSVLHPAHQARPIWKITSSPLYACFSDNSTYDGLSEGISIALPHNPPPSLVTGVTSDRQSISTYGTHYTCSAYSHLSHRQHPRLGQPIPYEHHRGHNIAVFQQASITDTESMFSCDPIAGPCPSMVTDTRSYTTESYAAESTYAPCPSFVSGVDEVSFAGDRSIALSMATSFGGDALPPPPPASPATTCMTQSEVSQSFQ